MVPEGILCSRTHEYLLEEDDYFKIGLTDYALEQLGDVVYIELPEVGTEFIKGEVFATIESVKAASEIYMPVSGRIIEINESIVERPDILNESPYETGWMIKIESDTAHKDSGDLLEYDDYFDEL